MENKTKKSKQFMYSIVTDNSEIKVFSQNENYNHLHSYYLFGSDVTAAVEGVLWII